MMNLFSTTKAKVAAAGAATTAFGMTAVLLIGSGSGAAFANTSAAGDAAPAERASFQASTLLQGFSETRSRTLSDVRYSQSAVGEVAIATATDAAPNTKAEASPAKHFCLTVAFTRGGGSVSCRDADRDRLPFTSVGKIGDGLYSVVSYLPAGISQPVVVSSDGSAKLALRIDKNRIVSAELSKHAAGELQYIDADGTSKSVPLKGMTDGD